jgi:integration host factor subunit alpha
VSRKQRKSASGHSAAWDAAEYTDLLAILQQELRGHYKLPNDLPHKILTLMMMLNDQGPGPTTRPGKTINREHLFHAVYENVGLPKSETAALVELVLKEILDCLERGETVKLSGFGSFVVRKKALRMGRNPRTGDEAPISPRLVVTFKPSEVLKRRINAPKLRGPETGKRALKAL